MSTRTVLIDPWVYNHLNATLPPGHPIGQFVPAPFGWGLIHNSTSQEGSLTRNATQYGNPTLGENIGHVYGPAWAALPADAVLGAAPGAPPGGMCILSPASGRGACGPRPRSRLIRIR